MFLKLSVQPNLMPDFSAPPPGWANPPGGPIVGPPPPQRIQQIPPPRMPISTHHVPHPQMIQQPPPNQPNFQVISLALKE